MPKDPFEEMIRIAVNRGEFGEMLRKIDVGRPQRAKALRVAKQIAKEKGGKGMKFIRDVALRRGGTSGKVATGALRGIARTGAAGAIPAAGAAAMGLVAKGVGDRIAGEAKLQQSLMRRTRQLQSRNPRRKGK